MQFVRLARGALFPIGPRRGFRVFCRRIARGAKLGKAPTCC